MVHRCPHCRTQLNTHGFSAGQIISCGVCNNQFQLPSANVVQPSARPVASVMPNTDRSSVRRSGRRNASGADQNTNLALALAGVIALIIGVFAPFMSIGQLSISLFGSLQRSEGLSRGLVCALLVFVGIACSITYFFTKKKVYLLIGAVVSTIAPLILLEFYIYLTNPNSDVPEQITFAQAFSMIVKPSLEFGFFLLVLGAALLYFGAFLKSR